MSRNAWILLPLFAACAPTAGDDADDATDTDADDTVADTDDSVDDTDDPSDTDDTEVDGPAVLWSEGFEEPTLGAFGSADLDVVWEPRSSHEGVSSAKVARSDSNEVVGGSPSAAEGAQFLAVLARRASNGADGFVRARHEVITDVVASMVDGTTYTLTGAFARVTDYETPSVATVRLFEPTQKGEVADGSWPAASAGAFASLDTSGDENAWQTFSVSFTATAGNAGQPLRLGVAVESAASDVDSVLIVDDLVLVGE